MFLKKMVNIISSFLRWVFVWSIKMLQYERIDVSEGIDFDKSDKSKECMISHY